MKNKNYVLMTLFWYKESDTWQEEKRESSKENIKDKVGCILKKEREFLSHEFHCSSLEKSPILGRNKNYLYW